MASVQVAILLNLCFHLFGEVLHIIFSRLLSCFAGTGLYGVHGNVLTNTFWVQVATNSCNAHPKKQQVSFNEVEGLSQGPLVSARFHQVSVAMQKGNWSRLHVTGKTEETPWSVLQKRTKKSLELKVGGSEADPWKLRRKQLISHPRLCKRILRPVCCTLGIGVWRPSFSLGASRVGAPRLQLINPW